MRIFIFILLFFSVEFCIAQTSINKQIPTILSPDIGSLAKFIDVPVSHHTGIPDISIPINTMKVGKDLTVPIALRYHASGIKVDELASNVGLGWNLEANGAIIQSINGLDDGISTGWINTRVNVPQNGILREDFYEHETINFDAPWYLFNSHITDGHADSQPDLFSYSIPGKSGKFFFTQQGEVKFMPFENMKVQFASSINGFISFTITDDKGIKYLFNTKETVGFERNSTCVGMEYGESGKSFFLDKIIAPNDEYIEYSYESYQYVSKIQSSESRANKVFGDNGCPVIIPCKIEQKEIVSSFRLQNIKSSAGEIIKFVYDSDSRVDLVNGKALKKILIETNNQSISTYELNYNYFNASTTSSDVTLNKRLKLISLVKNGVEKHIFNYNLLNLPHRLSLQQDHWGYFNGSLNAASNTLLPLDLNNNFMSGANRDTDPNSKFASILEQIIYPTGGSTTFQMESNEVYNNFSVTTPEQQGLTFTPLSSEIAVYEFSVPYSARTFKASWDISKVIFNAAVRLEKNGTLISTYTGKSNGMIDIPHLSPGNYQIKFQYATDPNDLASDNFRINWIYDKTENISENRYTGGLRIKNISHSAGANLPVVTKNYTYKLKGTAISSGKILYEPEYVYKRKLAHSTSSTHPFCEYMQQNSNSLAPLNLLSGGNVAYDYVEEHNSNNRIESGYTSFEYSNEGIVTPDSSDLSITGIKFPFAPRILNSWLNGIILRKIDYNYNKNTQEFSPLHMTEYEYSKQIGNGPNESYVRGATIGIKIYGSYKAFAIGYYYLHSSWIRLIKEKETLFSTLGSTEKIKEYFYENPIHGLPSRTKFSSSNGISYYNMTLFPNDYANGTTFIDDMKTKNLSSFPIENLKYMEANNIIKFLEGEVIQYKSGGKGLVDISYNLETSIPISISSFKRSNRFLGDLSFTGNVGNFERDSKYKVNYQFLSYDIYGNPQEIKRLNTPITVYVWGYGGQFPIAQIKNATYAEVLGVLTKATIDALNSPLVTETTITNAMTKLRTDSRLSKAMITSYTYRPLVGMTSKTDARGVTEYYEYDGMQRLKAVLDQVKNVTTSMDYHYRSH